MCLCFRFRLHDQTRFLKFKIKNHKLSMVECILVVIHLLCVLLHGARPNFIIILVDDQDLLMDSPSYMPSLQSLIVNEGMTFNNAFVATPVCCPSRTEFISGRYYVRISSVLIHFLHLFCCIDSIILAHPMVIACSSMQPNTSSMTTVYSAKCIKMDTKREYLAN